MIDIIERLRAWNDLDVAREAADEIDRLRAKLAEYENVPARDGYDEAKQSNHE